MFPTALYSRVVNMIWFYEYALLAYLWELSTCWYYSYMFFTCWIRDWSTCWLATHVLYCLGFESGQHVERLWTRSAVVDPKVVNMLTNLESNARETWVESQHVDRYQVQKETHTNRISTCWPLSDPQWLNVFIASQHVDRSRIQGNSRHG